jgi:hypothetical protein
VSDERVRAAERALERERQRAGLRPAFGVAMAERRLGVFFLEERVAERFPDVAQALLARVFIIEAAFRYEHRAWRYVAYGPDFPPIAAGAEPPVYELHEDLTDDGLSVRLFRLSFAVDGPAMRNIEQAAS